MLSCSTRSGTPPSAFRSTNHAAAVGVSSLRSLHSNYISVYFAVHRQIAKVAPTMYPSEKELTPLLPATVPLRIATEKRSRINQAARVFALVCICCTICYCMIAQLDDEPLNGIGAFYSTHIRPVGLCEGVDGKGESYAGYIGLKGDTETTPKRSFYWGVHHRKTPFITRLTIACIGYSKRRQAHKMHP